VEWHGALSESGRQTWDGLVELLRPGDDLRVRIAALESSEPSTEGEDPPSKSGTMLLLEGFEAATAP
jgi:hypothetical protein